VQTEYLRTNNQTNNTDRIDAHKQTNNRPTDRMAAHKQTNNTDRIPAHRQTVQTECLPTNKQTNRPDVLNTEYLPTNSFKQANRQNTERMLNGIATIGRYSFIIH